MENYREYNGIPLSLKEVETQSVTKFVETQMDKFKLEKAPKDSLEITPLTLKYNKLEEDIKKVNK